MVTLDRIKFYTHYECRLSKAHLCIPFPPTPRPLSHCLLLTPTPHAVETFVKLLSK